MAKLALVYLRDHPTARGQTRILQNINLDILQNAYRLNVRLRPLHQLQLRLLRLQLTRFQTAINATIRERGYAQNNGVGIKAILVALIMFVLITEIITTTIQLVARFTYGIMAVLTPVLSDS